MLIIDRTGLVIPTFFAVFIHESGHLLAMWAADCQPKVVRLIPTSVQIIRGFSKKPNSEAAISACGPMANVIVFATLYINYLIFGAQQSLKFAILNLVMAIFNMLPVSGLDGGVLLSLFISRFADIYKAEAVVRTVTMFMAFFVFVFGVYLWVSGTVNISVFIVAIYLVVCGAVLLQLFRL